MLRWMMTFLVATFPFAQPAEAAGPAGKAAARRAASQLPAGLPRPHYKFRTTIAPATPQRYAHAGYVADEADVLFTPSYGYVRYLPPAIGVDWLPGYPAWSGYWGLPVDYWSPWYAADVGTWDQQPNGYGYGYGYGHRGGNYGYSHGAYGGNYGGNYGRSPGGHYGGRGGGNFGGGHGANPVGHGGGGHGRH